MSEGVLGEADSRSTRVRDLGKDAKLRCEYRTLLAEFPRSTYFKLGTDTLVSETQRVAVVMHLLKTHSGEIVELDKM